MKNKVGLVIPIFNRPSYVKQCFDSLLKLTVKPDVIVLVDDASTDDNIVSLVLKFQHDYKGISTTITHEKNMGVRKSLIDGIEKTIDKGCDILINLDSDAIVKPDFIEVLLMHKQAQTKHIISGFNVHNDKNLPIKTLQNCCVLKPHANGINMCFNKQQYEKYIKPSLQKEGNWDYNTSLACQADNLPFVITTPSVIQHIGMVSSMGHTGADVAQDFKQLVLPDVTLFGIDSHDVNGIMRAAEISCRDITFGDRNIIIDDLFTKGGNSEQRRKDYSRFMIKELSKEFTTSHVLTIHADGYVVNWQAWSDEFLQYDYIGGVWDWYKDNQVGNGGMSLRSKKLCDILANHELEHYHPEDHHICRTYRKALEDMGIKFAPVEVAKRFSREGYGLPFELNKYEGEFGFHGYHVNWGTYKHYELPEEILPKNALKRKH